MNKQEPRKAGVAGSGITALNREFLINIAFLLLINLLIKPFYIFGIDRTVQNTVAPGMYGLYFALFNFSYLFQIVNDFGIYHFNNRNIAQHGQLLDKYFPNILILKGLLASVYLILVLGVALLWNYEWQYFPLLLLIAANQILNSLILFLRSNISGLGLYRTDSLISVTDRLLMILVCGILLLTPSFRDQFRIEWFVYAQTATLGITAIVAFSLVNRHIRRLRFRFRPAFLLLILQKSAPYALVIFLMTVYTRIDGVMIERMLEDGNVEAGYYASAYRLLDAANMFGFLFAGLLLPMFARLLHDKESLGQLARFSFQFIWAGAVSLAVATFFFRQEIMEALYTDGNAYSGQILGYLMISFVAVSGSYVYGTLLAAGSELQGLNIVALAGVLLNIVLNLLFIPTEKAMGAAMATCFTQFLVLGGQVFLAHRAFGFPFVPAMIVRMISFPAILFLIAYASAQYLPMSWVFRFLATLVAGVVTAFFIRLIRIRQVAGFILREKPG